jgi:hypothetical protein
MKFAIVLTKGVVFGCFCAGALAAAGCADGRGVPTSPSASANVAGLTSTTPGAQGATAQAVAPSAAARSGELHITKDCTENTGQPGGFCRITSSNIDAIEVGSKIIYAKAPEATVLDSDIVLDIPGPGNNKAFGHCRLDRVARVGLCTFSGGTGKFTHFEARARVSHLGERNWAWDGTYSFMPND